MKKISKMVVASHNAGKVIEIKALLAPFGVETISAAELDLPEPEETENSFAGNARLKALASAQRSGLPALSDDSGLVVDSLGGAPGIFSARWAKIPDCEGGGRDFDMAMWRVHQEIMSAGKIQKGDAYRIKRPSARFVCALCLAWPNGQSRIYEGKVEGRIVWPPRGHKGFGYDPIFQAVGDARTFAELAPPEKHAKSHRADAFQQFLTDQYPDE